MSLQKFRPGDVVTLHRPGLDYEFNRRRLIDEFRIGERVTVKEVWGTKWRTLLEFVGRETVLFGAAAFKLISRPKPKKPKRPPRKIPNTVA